MVQKWGISSPRQTNKLLFFSSVCFEHLPNSCAKISLLPLSPHSLCCCFPVGTSSNIAGGRKEEADAENGASKARAGQKERRSDGAINSLPFLPPHWKERNIQHVIENVIILDTNSVFLLLFQLLFRLPPGDPDPPPAASPSSGRGPLLPHLQPLPDPSHRALLRPIPHRQRHRPQGGHHPSGLQGQEAGEPHGGSTYYAAVLGHLVDLC